MRSDYVSLKVQKIKKFQSKSDQIFYNLVVIILIVFLISLSIVLIGGIKNIDGTVITIFLILLFLFILMFIIIYFWFFYDPKQSVARINNAMNFDKFKFENVSEYIELFEKKLDEILLVSKQITKTIHNITESELKTPNDLDTYYENLREFREYDEHLIKFLKNHQIPVEYIMINNPELEEFFGNKGNNYTDTELLVSKYNEIVFARNRNLVDFQKFKSKIDERNMLFSNWNEMIEILLKSRDGIQISLDRIASLGSLDSNTTEELLKLILEQNSDIGQYFEYEQSFIRGSSSDDIINSLKMKASNVSSERTIESLQKCNACDEFQSLLVRQCDNCGIELISCQICKRGYRKDEKQTACPNCQNSFHKNHLLEVIKTSGKCPICNEKVTEDQIKV